MINNPSGVLALAKREILRFMTVASQTIFPPLVSSALFICIFGLAIGKRIAFGHTEISYLGFIIPGLMTMHLISSSYENVSASLFIARWHNHIQEILLSPLSYFEMVLGLLAGGVARGLLVFTGVFLVSKIFYPTTIEHPILAIYFAVLISATFACIGMIAALWAEDFNMLSMWSTYFIMPLVFLGGVFHPSVMVPEPFRTITKFNPMYYFVDGIRYSVTNITETPLTISILFTFLFAVSVFFLTVYLFKIGYKLRT